MMEAFLAPRDKPSDPYLTSQCFRTVTDTVVCNVWYNDFRDDDILMPKSYKVCMMDIPINIFQRHIIN
jgi:hypothetical protein